MKKIFKFGLLLISIHLSLLSFAQTSNNVDNKTDVSFWLRGGYSHLIGYFGAELVIGYIGVECGYAPNRGTVETTSAIGIAASYFFNGSYKRGLYTSIGYMHNGYKKETYDGILPEVEWRGRFSGIVGYRIAW